MYLEAFVFCVRLPDSLQKLQTTFKYSVHHTLNCLLVPPGLLIGRVFEAYHSWGQCHCHFTKCLVPKNWCQMNDMDLIFQMIPYLSL